MAPAKCFNKACSKKAVNKKGSIPFKVKKNGIEKKKVGGKRGTYAAKRAHYQPANKAGIHAASEQSKHADEFSFLGQLIIPEDQSDKYFMQFTQCVRNLKNDSMLEGFGENIPGDSTKLADCRVEMEEGDTCSGIWTNKLDDSDSDVDSFLRLAL